MTTQRAPKRARQRAKGRPGPTPLILIGFDRPSLTWQPPRGRNPVPPPALVVLGTLRSGGTWDLAARMAKLNQATPREWNARGAQILADLDGESLIPDDDTPDETAAYLAFHLEAESARAIPIVSAISTIDRAARGGNVTAAEILLKRHPDAKAYRPNPRVEFSGPDGEPVPVEVRVAGLLAAARARLGTPDPAGARGEAEGELDAVDD